MAARLLGDTALDAENLGAGARAFVLRETGRPDIPSLVAALAAASQGAAAIIDNALAITLTGTQAGSDTTQENAP